ncbi:MAG: carbohydrate-binding protein [Planctomycetota bacterium]
MTSHMHFRHFRSPTLTAIAILASLFVAGIGHATEEDTILYVEKGTTAAELGYTLYLPPGYNDPANSERLYPVVVALLGNGERGDGTAADLDKTLKHGPMFNINKKGWNFPAIIIGPQYHNAWNNSDPLITVLDEVLINYRADPQAIYATGLCNGGEGAFRLAKDYPSYLAAIIPIQNSMDPATPENLVDIDVWAFHSWSDGSFPRRQSVKWMEAIAAARTGTTIDFWLGYTPPPTPNYDDPDAPHAGITRTAELDLDAPQFIWRDEFNYGVYLPVTDGTFRPQLMCTLWPTSWHTPSWKTAWNDIDTWAWLLRKSQTRTRPLTESTLTWNYTGSDTVDIPTWIPTVLPGRLEAEGFDRGLPGAAFQDDVGEVDLAGDESAVVDAVAGEWLAYTVYVRNGGIFDLTFHVASPGGGSLRLRDGTGSDVTGAVNVPDTGDETSFTAVEIADVTLPGGRSTLTLEILGGPIAIDAIEAAADELILDNRDATRLTLSGNWQASSGVSGYYGSDYYYTSDLLAPDATASFSAAIPADGQYHVYIRYAAKSSRSDAVPVTVTHDGGTSNHSVDMTVGGGVWQHLGTYGFTADDGGMVSISSSGTSGWVIADAVRFVPVPDPGEDPVDLIVDNRDTAYTEAVGEWYISASVAGYHATDYHYSSELTGDSFAYSANLPRTTEYDVYIQYAAKDSRSNAVPVDVQTTGGTVTHSVDMTTGGGTWQHLGRYELAAGLEERVVLRTAGTNGWVIADAVRFVEYEPEAIVRPFDLIIDNQDLPYMEYDGEWLASSGVPGYYGEDYRYADAGMATAATFRPDLPLALTYDVFIRYAAKDSRSDAVNVDIIHAGGTTTEVVDMQINGGIWVHLGRFDFAAGTDGAVRVRTDGSPGWAIADAVRFQEVEDLGGGPLDLIVDNRDTAQTAATGDWALSDGVAGFYGDDYAYATGDGKSFSFMPMLPRSALLAVSIRYAAKDSRDISVPVEVIHADGSYTYAVDMTVDGGTWVPLGAFAFDAGDSGGVVVTTDGTDGWVIADAVRFEEVDSLPPFAVTIDNRDRLHTSSVGDWPTSTASVGFYAADYAYDASEGSAGNSFTFAPVIPTAGSYEVFIQHPHDEQRASNVAVDLIHADGTASLSVDQTQPAGGGALDEGEMKHLGTYDFAADGSAAIVIRSDGADGWVTADAITIRETTAANQ